MCLECQQSSNVRGLLMCARCYPATQPPLGGADFAAFCSPQHPPLHIPPEEIEVPKGRRLAQQRRHGNQARSCVGSKAQSQQLSTHCSRLVGQARGGSGLDRSWWESQVCSLVSPARPQMSPVFSSHLATPRTPKSAPRRAFTRHQGCAGRVAASRARHCPCPSQ